MLGLALMAMRLADHRMWERRASSRISWAGQYSGPRKGPELNVPLSRYTTHDEPVSKRSAFKSPSRYPASHEYYQIMYRLSRGKPA